MATHPAGRKSQTISKIGFLVCFLMLIYPLVASSWNRYRSSLLATQYEAAVEEDPEYYVEMLEEAREYNEALAKSVDYVVNEQEHEWDEAYESLLDINGIMGYINIPAIQVTEAIYHYSFDSVLEDGVGHIHGSSLPVGAEEGGTVHSMLTGHCGLPTQKFFTDLDKLVEGDLFFLNVCGETFAYEVDKIQVVLPDDVDSLTMDEGEDKVTLVTCTPYGVNSHRLLVTGHRIPYTEETAAEEDRAYLPRLDIGETLILAVLSIFLVIFLFLFVKTKIQQHKRKKRMAQNQPGEGDNHA